MRTIRQTRVHIFKEHCDRGVRVEFPIGEDWYGIEHDELVRIIGKTTPFLKSRSWRVAGAGLGEPLHAELFEQGRDAVVDVLAAGASLRDALSAWKPRMRNGNDSSRPSSSGRRKRSEIQHSTPVQVFAGSAGWLPYRASCLTLAPAKRKHGDSFIQPPPTLAWLFVGRPIARTSATSFGIANAYIADLFPPEKRAQGPPLLRPRAGEELRPHGRRLRRWLSGGPGHRRILRGVRPAKAVLRDRRARLRECAVRLARSARDLAGISSFGYAFSPSRLDGLRVDRLRRRLRPGHASGQQRRLSLNRGRGAWRAHTASCRGRSPPTPKASYRALSAALAAAVSWSVRW